MLSKEENLNHPEKTTQEGSSFDFTKTLDNKDINKDEEDICEGFRLEAHIRCDGKYFKTAPVLREGKTEG